MPSCDASLARFAGLSILLAVAATVPAAVPPGQAPGNAPAESWRSSAQMAEAARALVETLDPARRARAVFPLSAPQRSSWSNLPIVLLPPPGLLLGDMSDAQRTAAHALLRASLSSQGYGKFTGVMRLDDLLHELDGQRYANLPEGERTALRKAVIDSFSYGNYALAIFGEPGADNWGWKLAGHHAAANFTVSNGRVGFTPTFLGSSPMVIEHGLHAGEMALPQEGSRGIDLMRALTDEQRQKATVAAEVAADVFEGAGRKASLAGFEGLPAGELTPLQMRLLQTLVAEYVRNAEFDAADAQLEVIAAAGWDKLWFSWRGPVDPQERFYYRVHGPRLLVEYNRQEANHDHSIVRDPQNDYGEDWLGQHLQEHHPSVEEAIEATSRRLEGTKPQ